jgi:hypothetical protein
LDGGFATRHEISRFLPKVKVFLQVDDESGENSEIFSPFSIFALFKLLLKMEKMT